MAALVVIALTACAPLQISEPPTVESACLEQFRSLDRKLGAARLHDAGAWRIPGFPFLRSTRFTASFAAELKTPEQQRVWIEALRAEDQQARVHELRNLGVSDPAKVSQGLADCGGILVAGTLNDTQRFELLKSRAAVPDDYSMLARVLGLYPLAAPFLKQGIARYHEAVRRNFAEPLESPPAVAMRVYAPPAGMPQSGAVPSGLPRDALGRPQLSELQSRQLLRRYAPIWWVEEASQDDVPGRPVWRQGQRTVDSHEPVVYSRIAHTRFDGRVLLQLVYTLWFPARPYQGPLDPYAGDFDGVVWRVTLGYDGRPLSYDSMHACGCYHYFFATGDVQRRPQDDWWQEPLVFPQPVVPASPVVLRLEARTHYLTRVLPLSAVSTENAGHYRLQDYDLLRSLPDGLGGHRSLFAANGLLPGSERLERFWLWPSGVASPGAMRQWGNHATAFVGRRHFDDPHLLDRLFKPPD